MKLLLLGGTDLTRAIACSVVEAGLALGGVVHVGRSIPISYDRRGIQNYRHSDMGEWCSERGIPNHEFTDNKKIAVFANEVDADFLLVAGWYHFVPQWVRALFPKGAAGIHASLLPKLRGGAPLPWAILSGAKRTGVSMFVLGDAVDAGDLYGQTEITIGSRTSVTDLVTAVEHSSATLVTSCLKAIAAGTMKTFPQTGSPTYCLQRTPEDGRIDWQAAASDIDRLVRAVSTPYPGAFGSLEGRRVTVWQSDIAPESVIVFGRPGQIARVPEERDPVIVTGCGSLIIRRAEIDGADAIPLLRKSAHMAFATP